MFRLTETEQICLLEPNMVFVILGKGGSSAEREKKKTRLAKMIFVLANSVTTVTAFSQLNLCPTSQITPNVISWRHIVLCQVACCIMH